MSTITCFRLSVNTNTNAVSACDQFSGAGRNGYNEGSKGKGGGKSVKRTRGQRTNNESKMMQIRRAKGEISCAECRRLKLRCDRSLPCSSCVRRGCAVLCPNGVLPLGQGSRSLFADTTELHQKLDKMHTRIRALEEALAVSYSQHSSNNHPLLGSDLLDIKNYASTGMNIKSGDGERIQGRNGKETKDVKEALDKGVLKSFDNMALESQENVDKLCDRRSGNSLFSLAQEGTLLQQHSIQYQENNYTSLQESMYNIGVAPEFSHLNDSTFYSSSMSSCQVLESIRHLLPTYERAHELCESYMKSIGWYIQPVPKEQLFNELLPMVYRLFEIPSEQVERTTEVIGEVETGEKRDGPLENGEEFTRSNPTLCHEREKSPGTHSRWEHDLAAFLAILALGTLGELDLCPSSTTSENFVYWSRVLLSLGSGFSDPGISTVQSLFLIGTYYVFSMKERGIDKMTKILSLGSMLMFNLELHKERDLEEPESAIRIQRRRHVFWEIRCLELWMSLNSGNSPQLHPDYIECRHPGNGSEASDGEVNNRQDFFFWKHKFVQDVLEKVVFKLGLAKSLSYTEILELDQLVREFGPISFQHDGINTSTDVNNSSERGDIRYFVETSMLKLLKESTLLALHRNFFASALLKSPSNPTSSEFSVSFLAAFSSAVVFLRVARENIPEISPTLLRCWSIWTPILDSALIVGSVASRTPTSEFGQKAFKELSDVMNVLGRMRCHPAVHAKFPLLERLHAQAYQALLKAGILSEDLQNGSSIQAAISHGDGLELRQNRIDIESTPEHDSLANQNRVPPYWYSFSPYEVQQPQLSLSTSGTKIQGTAWENEGLMESATNNQSALDSGKISAATPFFSDMSSTSQESLYTGVESSNASAWLPHHGQTPLPSVYTSESGYTFDPNNTDNSASAFASGYSDFMSPRLTPNTESNIDFMGQARNSTQAQLYGLRNSGSFIKHTTRCSDESSPRLSVVKSSSERDPDEPVLSPKVQTTCGTINDTRDQAQSTVEHDTEISGCNAFLHMDVDETDTRLQHTTSTSLYSTDISNPLSDMNETKIQTGSQVVDQGAYFSQGENKEMVTSIDATIAYGTRTMGPFSAPAMQVPMYSWMYHPHQHQGVASALCHQGIVYPIQAQSDTGVNHVSHYEMKQPYSAYP